MTKTVFDTATALLPQTAALSDQMAWPWDERDRKRRPLCCSA